MLLHANVTNLQHGGQVARYLTGHLGHEMASPALFSPIGHRFGRDVNRFAAVNNVPFVRLDRPGRARAHDHDLDRVRPYMSRAKAAGRVGVVAIVAAQESHPVFSGRTHSTTAEVVSYTFTMSSRRVTTMSFYILDPDVGLGYIKICTYFPYPAHVWMPDQPVANQADDTPTATTTGVDAAHSFFERWTAQIPTPFTTTDRAAGYWWALSDRPPRHRRGVN